MKRIIHAGFAYEVVHGPKGPNGETPEGAPHRIMRFLGEDEILDFPLTKGEWEEIVEMGAETDGDPLKKAGFETVQSMPGILREPPRRPNPRR